MKLQAALCQSMQEAGGSGTSKPFQPHLSVGQVTGRAKMLTLVDQLQATWSPLLVMISGVAMIWRNEPPDDVFRVAAEIPLIE